MGNAVNVFHGWSQMAIVPSVVAVALLAGCGGAGQHMPVDSSSLSGAGGASLGAPGGNYGALTYVGRLQALFQSKCSVCHNANSPSTQPNWLDYNTVYAFKAVIYQKVVVDKTMPMSPYNASMTDADRQTVAAWINAGAPEGSISGGASGGNNGGSIGTGSGPTPGGGDGTSSPGGGIVYSSVVPIFTSRCVTCHRSTWSYPLNWLDYDTAYSNRGAIYEYVKKGYMPLENQTGMTLDERKTIESWVEAGAPSGALRVIPAGSKPTFVQDALPIIANRCVLCHSTDNNPKAPNWTKYDVVKKYIKEIKKRIVVDADMPPQNYTKMTMEERDRIGAWISSGAIEQ